MSSDLRRLADRANAFLLDFDPCLLDEARASFRRHLARPLSGPSSRDLRSGGKPRSGPTVAGEAPYFLVTYGSQPLLWFSANSDASFAVFANLFGALDLENRVRHLVDCRDSVRLYSGFFVVCDRAASPMWHLDYVDGANAYTLVTPLQPLAAEHGHLRFRNPMTGADERYRYKSGEAAIFGDRFLHTTEPFPPTPNLRVLLSMTFGTDKTVYWPKLRETLGRQARYLVLPCGHRYGSCECIDRPAAGRLRSDV